MALFSHDGYPVRDRFDEFRRLRSSAPAPCRPCVAAAHGESDARAAQVHGQPLWMRVVSDFNTLESIVRSQLKAINSEQLALQRTRFDTGKEASSEADRQMLRQRRDKLVQLSQQLDCTILRGALSHTAANDEEAAIVQTIAAYLSSKLRALNDELHQSSEAASQMTRRQQMTVEAINSSVGSAASRDIVAQESRLAEYMQQGCSDAEAGRLLLETQQHQLADQDVQDVLKDLQSVNAIFENINALVLEQGTTLDNIACNVHSACTRAKQANSELKEAARQQSSCSVM